MGCASSSAVAAVNPDGKPVAANSGVGNVASPNRELSEIDTYDTDAQESAGMGSRVQCHRKGLYNLLQNGAEGPPFIRDPEYILLVDCRDYAQYEEKHISVARHLSLLEGLDLSRYDVAVYYDDDGVVEGPAWKARVQHITQCRENDPAYDETEENLHTLSGGWNKFIVDYPTLCIPEMIYHPRKLKDLNTLPAEILHKKIYLGSFEHSQDKAGLSGLGIKHIVNVSSHGNPFEKQGFEYLKIDVPDTVEGVLQPYFEECNAFMKKALGEGSAVLVHCHRGMSRSSTMVIAYMMAEMGMSLEDAHVLVKACRQCMRPNDAFIDQMAKYEVHLMGKQVSNVDSLYHL